MANLTEHQWDNEISLKPFVVVRAHRSIISGWIPTVHANYKRKAEAIREAKKLMDARCTYCRVEKWPMHDGGEQVLQEFGINPGIDEAIDSRAEIAAIAMREWWAERKGGGA